MIKYDQFRRIAYHAFFNFCQSTGKSASKSVKLPSMTETFFNWNEDIPRLCCKVFTDVCNVEGSGTKCEPHTYYQYNQSSVKISQMFKAISYFVSNTSHLNAILTSNSGSSIRSKHVALTMELWAAESAVNVMWVKILFILLTKAHLMEEPTSGAKSCRYGVNMEAFTMACGLLSSLPSKSVKSTTS